MMDLMAHRTRDHIAVLGGVFGGKALNAVSGRRAAVYEERHAILNKSQLSRCSITDVYLVQCNSCRKIVPHFAFYARPDDGEQSPPFLASAGNGRIYCDQRGGQNGDAR